MNLSNLNGHDFALTVPILFETENSSTVSVFPSGGDSHLKATRMLAVSLRDFSLRTKHLLSKNLIELYVKK